MSKEELDDGFAVISAIAHGDKGLKKKLRLGMFSDPGYSETAKMSAETAITLVLHDKELKVNFHIFYFLGQKRIHDPCCLLE